MLRPRVGTTDMADGLAQAGLQKTHYSTWKANQQQEKMGELPYALSWWKPPACQYGLVEQVVFQRKQTHDLPQLAPKV